MSFVAKLYHDARTAERYPVLLDGTLRNSQAEPRDVVIEELSATGFRTAAMPGIVVGDNITLGVFGVGLRRANVLRESNGGYGCQFLIPLNQSELATALCGLAPPEPISFPTALLARSDGLQLADKPEWTLSPRLRVLTIAAIAVVPWFLLSLAWIYLSNSSPWIL